MLDRNVDEKLVAMIQEMYHKESSSIIVNGEQGRDISISKGVRQGGCSSPISFNLIPNELANSIDERGMGQST